MQSPGFTKPTHGYGTPLPVDAPAQDQLMSCPCGRGDYELCTDCPYETCSEHGSGWAGEGFTVPVEPECG